MHEKRITRIYLRELFASGGDRKVRDAIAEVFIILLQTLGEKHVCPAFAKATQQMGNYRAEDYEVGTQVAPLVQFFELVHIGDTIQQMVEVYFDKEMVSPLPLPSLLDFSK